MSAIGTKRTWASALHMSAFGGKADLGPLSGGMSQRAAHGNRARHARVGLVKSAVLLISDL